MQTMVFSFILDLWKKWNIRGFVILSLLLQVFLIFFAPLRKKTADCYIIFLLWLAYLMADLVAAFSIGLISHGQGNPSTHVAEVDGTLQAFWASFLLLHLGGPDTITAFSLEDSSLWRRHLLSLIFQARTAIYVFVRIFSSDKSLMIPTILVFLAGVIKIAERTLALYLSSLPRVRESTFLNKELTMATGSPLLEELNVLGDEHGLIDEGRAKLDESIVVKHAYLFFRIFEVFMIDLIFKKQQREMSREYFAKVSAVDALRVISVELNFIYEKLHTKAMAIRHKWSYIFHIITCTSIAVALGQFNRLKKYRLPELDVRITYILLFGGIILDVIALLMLVFSDWTLAGIKHNITRACKPDSYIYKLVSATDYLRKPRYTTCEVEPNTNVTYEVLDTPLIFRRWSESISACNIFSEKLNKSPRKIYKCNQFWVITIFTNIYNFSLQMVDKIISCFYQASETIMRLRFCHKRSMIANVKYMSRNPFITKLWIFIFNDVKEISRDADNLENVRQMVTTGGNMFLTRRLANGNFDQTLGLVTKATFHALIIRFHIVTEILYNKDKHKGRNDEREFSKILSDYMLYLLFNQSNVMSSVAPVDIAQLLLAKSLRELRHPEGAESDYDWFRSVQRLKDNDEKWNYLSGVWVGALQYAAVNIKGEAHVQVLSRGGELLAFVWLLMAHFGCFYKPEWGMYLDFWGESTTIEIE